MTEKAEARRDGARLQRNSGRGPHSKADATDDVFVIDYKEYSKSFSVSREVWAKIVMDTIRVDRTKQPMIKAILGEGNEKVRLAIIEHSFLQELVRTWLDAQEGDTP